jgi:8-oxo-dGTP diphosphatase
MHTTQRVAAYAVCRRDDQILLARFVAPDGAQRYWTLPGGGIDHAEDPYDAVVREVAEETGYTARVDRLLGVDSRTVPYRRSRGELHNIGVFYRATVVGGQLRSEVGGSTDLAAWLPVADVPGLPRAQVVDLGLALDRDAPPTGHLPPVQVVGLLRP